MHCSKCEFSLFFWAENVNCTTFCFIILIIWTLGIVLRVKWRSRGLFYIFWFSWLIFLPRQFMHITFFLFSERWNTVLKFDAKKALQLCWWAENFGLKNAIWVANFARLIHYILFQSYTHVILVFLYDNFKEKIYVSLRVGWNIFDWMLLAQSPINPKILLVNFFKPMKWW